MGIWDRLRLSHFVSDRQPACPVNAESVPQRSLGSPRSGAPQRLLEHLQNDADEAILKPGVRRCATTPGYGDKRRWRTRFDGLMSGIAQQNQIWASTRFISPGLAPTASVVSLQ